MMSSNSLFDRYKKSSARMPRDSKFLEGMFAIRRTPGGERPFAAGEILKASATVQRFQVLEYDTKKADWVAFAALVDDVILFHSSGEMWACYSCLARTWQEEAKAGVQHDAA
jgi:hypothetical protein